MKHKQKHQPPYNPHARQPFHLSFSIGEHQSEASPQPYKGTHKEPNPISPREGRGEASTKHALQSFIKQLNTAPGATETTPCSNATTIPIAQIEHLLDHHYHGHWSTTQFYYQQLGSHLSGTITLTVMHPITGSEIKRQGVAAIPITSPATLHLDIPRLKTETLKNAAHSLGKIFGRDLNRKMPNVPRESHNDTTIPHEYLNDLYQRTMHHLTPQQQQHANRILQNQETISYPKLFNQLKDIQQGHNHG